MTGGKHYKRKPRNIHPPLARDDEHTQTPDPARTTTPLLT